MDLTCRALTLSDTTTLNTTVTSWVFRHIPIRSLLPMRSPSTTYLKPHSSQQLGFVRLISPISDTQHNSKATLLGRGAIQAELGILAASRPRIAGCKLRNVISIRPHPISRAIVRLIIEASPLALATIGCPWLRAAGEAQRPPTLACSRQGGT